MKRLAFIMLNAAILIAVGVHILIAYFEIMNDAATSFPPETAFLLLIPYAIAAIAVNAVWGIVCFVRKRRRNRSAAA